MKTLVVGASGATGKHLVEQLLRSGHQVKIIVRSTGNIPEQWNDNAHVTIIRGNVSEMDLKEMTALIADCQAVASCLGHNLSWKGIYGKPRKLVADTVKLLCTAMSNTGAAKPFKLVLMNTAGNRNRDLNEPISFAQKIVMSLIRLLVPPHVDNEEASDYLRVVVGQKNPNVEWAVVRPDTLLNESSVSKYSLHASPSRSAIFNPGKTSRINVGHFMANLIKDDNLWHKWKGQMPVIYNEEVQ